MKIYKLTAELGYPVYYNTLTPFPAEYEVDIEQKAGDLKERTLDFPSLVTTCLKVSSFHRPISKMHSNVYRRSSATSNTI